MRLNNPLSSPIRGPVHGLFTDMLRYPDGAILYYDANTDAYTEQTYGPHTFNSSILSPQYQRNANGSYTDVGANPAVDVFDGEKWLRSCGAVTNLLPSGAENFAGALWNKLNLVAPTLVNGRWKLVSANGVTGQAYRSIAPSVAGTYNFSIAAKAGEFRYLRIAIGVGFIAPRVSSLYVDLLNGVVATGVETGSALVSIAPGADGEWIISFPCTYSGSEDRYVYISPRNVVNDSVISGDGISGIYLRNPQTTATAYPVPYTPPGTTMPASNATTTNGCWFTLADGSPVWKALTGEPLTLATRVRMGVGNGDLRLNTNTILDAVSCQGVIFGVQFSERTSSNTDYIVRSYDRAGLIQLMSTWPRNAILRRITQVNTAGTQFRVGYMIEGTHTTIQWSSWAAYDGSFNPSTLYRLMLGYANTYPMWFNKIAVWNTQVDDATILKWMKP